MKNLLLLIAFLGATSFAKTQGNLQFNQVLTFSGGLTASPNSTTNSSIQTVPIGKVWKIESVGGGYISPTLGSSYMGAKVNNGLSIFRLVGSSLNNSGVDKNICPIWLRSGDNMSIEYYNSNSGNAQSTSYVISIIEFNIIP
jgi:hypothetical protein